MLYSNTCEYALRALVHLAESPGRYVLSQRVASAEDIPYPFLKKIVKDLVRVGFVVSARGPHGGVKLARPAERISLFDVRGAVDGNADLERCVFGLGRCNRDRPCPHHERWVQLKAQIRAYLQATTLLDLVQTSARRRTLLRRKAAASSPGGETGAPT